MKTKPSRQARSIARIRAERKAARRCRDCGNPAARKRIACSGRIKILSRCAPCLALLAAAAVKYR
ncbi:MAG: hypothetical protein HOP33_09100 [Verrucomicrobia bacterium]|nr:hypothetical protein [Verrucomicrobiota bacterium]